MRGSNFAKSPRGFTLIELLVVIAIIGLLSSIVVASLQSARSKARDAVRLSDMHTIRTALELYANNHNGQYPAEIPGGVGSWGNWECGNAKDSGHPFLQALVTDGDISSVPKETYWPITPSTPFWPSGWTACSYRYLVGHMTTDCGSPSGNYAVLFAALENPAPSSCLQPACWVAAGWGEATGIDPTGCLMILPE
jgi:prepilin-type N-terminal cleavage/methylation domain-containing protein